MVFQELVPNKAAGRTVDLTHDFFLEMRGLGQDFDNAVDDVLMIREPLDIRVDEIANKSKGDLLTKLLVVTQTTWFMLLWLARWVTHLHVTELEVVTRLYTS